MAGSELAVQIAVLCNGSILQQSGAMFVVLIWSRPFSLSCTGCPITHINLRHMLSVSAQLLIFVVRISMV